MAFKKKKFKLKMKIKLFKKWEVVNVARNCAVKHSV